MSETKGCETEGKVETCEACGTDFRCEPMRDCWCFGVTVSQQTRDRLRTRFTRCLCRECLAKANQPAQE